MASSSVLNVLCNPTRIKSKQIIRNAKSQSTKNTRSRVYHSPNWTNRAYTATAFKLISSSLETSFSFRLTSIMPTTTNVHFYVIPKLRRLSVNFIFFFRKNAQFVCFICYRRNDIVRRIESHLRNVRDVAFATWHQVHDRHRRRQCPTERFRWDSSSALPAINVRGCEIQDHSQCVMSKTDWSNFQNWFDRNVSRPIHTCTRHRLAALYRFCLTTESNWITNQHEWNIQFLRFAEEYPLRGHSTRQHVLIHRQQ